MFDCTLADSQNQVVPSSPDPVSGVLDVLWPGATTAQKDNHKPDEEGDVIVAYKTRYVDDEDMNFLDDTMLRLVVHPELAKLELVRLLQKIVLRIMKKGLNR